MGCGRSVPVSHTKKKEIANTLNFSAEIKKQTESTKLSLEEARRRRAAGAKQRTRRASLMGQIEAEKLKERKRSICSLHDVSDNDESLQAEVGSFDPESKPTLSVPKLKTDASTQHDNVELASKKSSCNSDILQAQIEIIVSPGTRTNSSATINDTREEDNSTNSTKDVCKNDNIDTDVDDERERQIQAEAIVKKVLEEAMSTVSKN